MGYCLGEFNHVGIKEESEYQHLLILFKYREFRWSTGIPGHLWPIFSILIASFLFVPSLQLFWAPTLKLAKKESNDCLELRIVT